MCVTYAARAHAHRGNEGQKKKKKGRIIVEENFHKTRGEERDPALRSLRVFIATEIVEMKARDWIFFFICWFTDELPSVISQF